MPKTQRQTTVISEPRVADLAPFIRLRGLWLRDIGIDVGDVLTIQVEDDRLVITRQCPS
jgi:hypothetical protein